MNISKWNMTFLFLTIGMALSACSGGFKALNKVQSLDSNSQQGETNGGSLPPVSPTALIPYQVTVAASNIAVTPSTQPSSQPASLVPPRNDDGQHPSTLWDQQDIMALASQLTTNTALAANYAALKTYADKRITLMSTSTTFTMYGGTQTYGSGYVAQAGDFTLHGVPVPHMVDGVAQYIADPTDISSANASTMMLLAIMYQMTGNTEYGEFVHQMLLDYAQYYGTYPHTPGWTIKSYRSANDGRLSYQFLDDAIVLAQFGWAFDLIYNLPAFTALDQTNVRVNFLEAVAEEFSDPILGTPDYLSSPNNRSAISAAAVLICGYASDDTMLINNALYGTGGTPGNPKRGGGITTVHWGSNIDADGLWIESSLGYQTSIASAGVFDAAVVMEHHNMDVFGKYPLKRMLDSAIGIAYPDPQMQLPDVGNSTASALIASAAWESNELGAPYEYGYLYYGDSSYLPIVRNASQSLMMTIHSGPPSLFLNTPAPTVAAPVVENVNFYINGYGVMRLASNQGASAGINQLLVEYGSNLKSHAQPNGMAIDLFALGDLLAPLPGDIFPYNLAIDPAWYWTTVASNTLVVDQATQIEAGTYDSKTMSVPSVNQIVYGFSATMALQKVSSNSLYTGVNEDRAVFMTPNYVADVFGGFSTTAHTFDLPWHFIGSLKTSLAMTARTTSDFTNPGYESLTDVMHTKTDGAWNSAITTSSGKPASLWVAANPGAEIMTADGHLYVYDQTDEIQPPLIIERQSGVNNALFGNVLDISGGSYVSGVTMEPITSNGQFAALMRIQHGQATDYAFSSFAPGSYTSADGSLSSDAWQASVVVNQNSKLTGVFLGGGTMVSTTQFTLSRADSVTPGAPGMVSLELQTDGSWLVGNPSPTAAAVHVKIPSAGIDKTIQLAASARATL